MPILRKHWLKILKSYDLTNNCIEFYVKATEEQIVHEINFSKNHLFYARKDNLCTSN